MTNATLNGKPYAGNPHVRFEVGGSRIGKPRRGSLLYKKVAVLECSRWWRFVAFAGAFVCVLLSAEATVPYQGPDGGYLNDPANWSGTFPTTDWLGFKDVPSSEYTVKLSDDLQTDGGIITDGESYTVHFDLAPYTFRALGHHYLSRPHATHILESGTLELTKATGATNTVQFSDEAQSWDSTFIVRNPGTKLVGNISMAHGSGNVARIEKGARVDGIIQVLAASNTAYVTGAGTVVDYHSLPNYSGTGYMLVLGAHENNQGCERDCRMYITDGAMVTNVTGLRIGAGLSSNRAGIDNLLCVSNATLHITRTSTGHVIGGMRPDAHGNRVEFIAGAQVTMGGSGSSHILDVGSEGAYSNSFYIAGAGTLVSNGWANGDGPLIAGPDGKYNVIEITDHALAKIGGISSGGQVKNTRGTYTSCWNRVTISNGAVVDVSALACATRHSDQKVQALTSEVASNLLEITSGAIVTNTANGGTTVGALAPFHDNVMRVTGAGTVLATRSVNVGTYGSRGNRFEVSDQAQLVTLSGGTVTLNIPSTYGGSNNVFAVRNVNLAVNGVYLGLEQNNQGGWTSGDSRQLWCGTGGNTLEVGENADLSISTLSCRGQDSRVVVSNGTLRLTNGFYPWDGKGAEYYPENPRHTHFVFSGETPALVVTGGNWRDFSGACTFTFNVPLKGYQTSPYQPRTNCAKFPDGMKFKFTGLEECARVGGAKMNLVDTTGGSATITMSDALLAEIDAAAKADYPKAKVTLSDDKKVLSLKVPGAGLMILFR